MAILLIQTGGTIAMAPGPDGLAPRAGVIEAGLAALGDLGPIEILRLDPAIDSANATFRDWNRIADAVAKGHDRFDGFVVAHGTDTLAFTAAALTFALAGLRKPVIVTGSMLPFGAAGSDAPRNLGDAIRAAKTAPAGVWVQFAGQLMHGARVRKAHSHALDAFVASPSDAPPLVQADRLTVTEYRQPEIAILSMAPNQSVRAMVAVLAACDGVVLRVFGAGTLPNDPALMAALKDAGARGVLMIAVSSSPEGGVSFGTYAAGAPLIAAGVVDGGDMTVEAAYAKLAHVLAQGTAARLAQNLCGEWS